jgi:hypothetical protein
MSFLDQKEVIYDVVLTDRGRQLLSKNQLNFSFYAFSDEGINYKDHLSSSIVLSQSVDNLARKNLFFESDQRKNRDLSSFLYTIPLEKKVLPKVTISVDISSSLSLERRYSITSADGLEGYTNSVASLPVDVIARLALPHVDEISRAIGYGNSQIVESILSGLLK